ncbi:MAG: hypothetical protein WC791_04015 [Candidatus Paceibacterota bacterium]|jgi:hypothetical protein
MKIINLKDKFKKLIYSKGTDSYKREIAPYRDWQIIIIIIFAGLSASFVFNVYLSIGINNESYFTTAPRPAGVTTFNEDGLAKVVADINQKATLFEKAQTEVITVVDPAL